MLARIRQTLGPLGVLAAHLEILVLCGVLLGAFGYQFLGQEMPCPLCILQRLFMMLAALGAMWIIRNSRDGTVSLADYAIGHGMIILSALCGSFVSTRQILLHIIPPDPGYGGTELGLHLYTWALIVFLCLIGSSTVCLLFPRFFLDGNARSGKLTAGVLGLLGAVILGNTVAIFFETGFHWKLKDNPRHYRLLREFAPKPTPREKLP